MTPEFEQLLETWWAGELDADGLARIEALAATDAELAGIWHQEQQLSGMLQAKGAQHAPSHLAESVMARLAEENSAPGKVVALEPFLDESTGDRHSNKGKFGRGGARKLWGIPMVKVAVAASIACIVVVQAVRLSDESTSESRMANRALDKSKTSALAESNQPILTDSEDEALGARGALRASKELRQLDELAVIPEIAAPVSSSGDAGFMRFGAVPEEQPSPSRFRDTTPENSELSGSGLKSEEEIADRYAGGQAGLELSAPQASAEVSGRDVLNEGLDYARGDSDADRIVLREEAIETRQKNDAPVAGSEIAAGEGRLGVSSGVGGGRRDLAPAPDAEQEPKTPVIGDLPSPILADTSPAGSDSQTSFVFEDAFNLSTYVGDDFNSNGTILWSYEFNDNPMYMSNSVEPLIIPEPGQSPYSVYDELKDTLETPVLAKGTTATSDMGVVISSANAYQELSEQFTTAPLEIVIQQSLAGVSGGNLGELQAGVAQIIDAQAIQELVVSNGGIVGEPRRTFYRDNRAIQLDGKLSVVQVSAVTEGLKKRGVIVDSRNLAVNGREIAKPVDTTETLNRQIMQLGHNLYFAQQVMELQTDSAEERMQATLRDRAGVRLEPRAEASEPLLPVRFYLEVPSESSWALFE